MLSRSILILPRLFLGVIFGVAVYPKLTAPSPGFRVMLLGFVQQLLPNAHPLYQSFLRAIVLPNAGTIAVLVMAGELLVAIGMLLGVTTRLAAVVAVFLLLNYMLAKGMSLWSPASNDAADIIIAIVIGLGAAGRVFGIDSVLARRWPQIPLW